MLTLNLTINGDKPEALIKSITVKKQLNAPSTLTFTIEEYDFGEVFDIVELYDENNLLFKGKITEITPNAWDNSTDCHAIEEGALKLLGIQIAETYNDMKFTDVVADVCTKAGLSYNIDEFTNTFEQYNISYRNGMQVIQDIAQILDADFYIENGTLYFFKKGSKVSSIVLGKDAYIEDIQLKKDNTNFGNDIIVIGDKDSTGIPLMAEAKNHKSIDTVGLFQRVIKDDSLKTKEACVIKAIIECRNRSDVRTTGSILLLDDVNCNIGEVVRVTSSDLELDTTFRIITSTLKYSKSNGVSYELEIDSRIADVPVVLVEMDKRLRSLETKDVDTVVNKFRLSETSLSFLLTQQTTVKNYGAHFDEDTFDFATFF
jgi:hypothetical protein